MSGVGELYWGVVVVVCVGFGGWGGCPEVVQVGVGACVSLQQAVPHWVCVGGTPTCS